MHEYSIVQALLAEVEGQARRRRAVAVTRIALRIGELAGVEVDLLRTAFSTFRERSIAAGASLDVETVPAVWECPACKRRLAAGARLSCPECGAPARLAAGDEIVLQRLEMEAA